MEINKLRKTQPMKVRDSNLELYRIIVMLLIIAYHYVANSGIMTLVYEDPTSGRSLFALLFAAWGKPGINCFVLITGYFMCTSKITTKKFAKLLLEIYFYRIIIYLVFLLSGYEPFSIKTLLKAIAPMTSLASNFSGCYLLFFLMIPFLNILIRNMSQKMHFLLVCLCLLIYTVIGGLGGLPFFTMDMNYVSWFSVLYIIASYIRLYPNPVFENTKLWGWLTVASVVLSGLSVVACAWIGEKIAYPKLAFFFVSDSNKILALAFGLSSFLFFKNVKIPNSKFINLVGGSTFGVLLIHANSATMRRWLWVLLLKNVQVFRSEYLVLHATISVICIFIVCSVIDIVRIQFLEKPFFAFWDKHWDSAKEPFISWGRALCEKLDIK